MLVTNQQINKLAASHMFFKLCDMLKGSCGFDTLHRLHTSPNLTTWTTLLAVNITGQKVHVEKGGSTDDSDTNNSNNNNYSSDDNNNNDIVAIGATNILADVQLAKTIGTYCISSHAHLLI